MASNSDSISNNAETPNPDPIIVHHFEIDSSCSTPYVSAPSSPGRGAFFYSAPASPVHFTMLSVSKQSASEPCLSKSGSFEFQFSARFGSSGSGPMSSADELFLDGQIRPMKLSSHLERPQVLAPLLDLGDEDDDEAERSGTGRGRGSRSGRRRARSMSPMRFSPFRWMDDVGDGGTCSASKESRKKNNEEDESGKAGDTISSESASSSRSSSARRSSRRWVFLDFLRSKSEGRSNSKFWSTITFSPAGKQKKPTNPTLRSSVSKEKRTDFPIPATTQKVKTGGSGEKPAAVKPVNGLRKRRVMVSAHEVHYTANRAQAEELRKKTYLPYRQGVVGCLGYGASNGFTRALKSVSSR